ncbi:hypothetical protein [Thalassotalea sp. ND16A]|uniref:hypothetical protein n=1 Tax=Thalassotalea sp. ND16A TaxID=1535422 RepID=UPI00051A3B79|nr:hypothetical protein [Thalassotalea sp. ND16A]KGJ95779.1 hypothetical protein ND16A_1314 [Thalassotalea sp. ND16A]
MSTKSIVVVTIVLIITILFSLTTAFAAPKDTNQIYTTLSGLHCATGVTLQKLNSKEIEKILELN